MCIYNCVGMNGFDRDLVSDLLFYKSVFDSTDPARSKLFVPWTGFICLSVCATFASSHASKEGK
jgi:hypothetical protein